MHSDGGGTAAGSSVPYPQRPITDVYDAAYSGVPNWDIGRPQRAYVSLANAGLIRGPVLDVGCGTGELSLFVARLGHEVLGIDLSSVAIRQAREKARWRGIPAQFLVLDALDLPALARNGFSFRTVLDCAMFHLLGDAERDRFVDGLETVIEPGGLVCILGDARGRPDAIYGVTPAEIRRRFGDGWTVEFSYRTVFERRWRSNPAYFVGLRAVR